jgi:hypothetical protein
MPPSYDPRMKTTLLTAVALTILATSTLATRAAQSTSGQPIDKAFAKGGSVVMRLSAGDYRITGTADDKIRVDWRVDRASDAEALKAKVEISGAKAVIETSGARHGSVHYTIDIPSRSDIEIDLSAGDLQVRGIEGSKRVESWAGDLSIEIGRPEQYRNVEASVRAGDLSARPFNVSKGGLFRSFTWTGNGKYSLLVKLVAGDLTLK